MSTKRNIILKEDENIITDTGELCEIFAKFFSNVAINSIRSPDHIDRSRTNFLSPLYAKHKEHSSVKAILERFKDNLIKFKFKNVNSSYMEKLLSKINGENATGYDNIPPKIVKMCSNELSVTLTELINHSFETGRFPEDMKKAESSPIFKKKHDMIKDIYRPISLLDIVSKVFETMVAEQLMEYFKEILISCYVHTERSMVQNMF